MKNKKKRKKHLESFPFQVMGGNLKKNQTLRNMKNSVGGGARGRWPNGKRGKGRYIRTKNDKMNTECLYKTKRRSKKI